MITTGESWFNHLREDKTVSILRPKPTRCRQRFRKKISQHPVQVMKDPIVLSTMRYKELGTGFDGVKGGQLDEHVRKQYLIPTTGAPNHNCFSNDTRLCNHAKYAM